MSVPQTFEPIAVEALLEKVRAKHTEGWRLVQISATRLPEQVELTYSFDLDCRLANFRLHLPADGARVPSISSIYWCAFLYENELHDLFNVQVDGMAVDFHGNLYKMAVKFPFGTTKAPVAKPAAPATTPAPAPGTAVHPAPASARPVSVSPAAPTAATPPLVTRHPSPVTPS